MTSTTDYQTAARAAAIKAGIDPNIFIRQIQQESGFNPYAVSPAGAQGIAQFMPATAKGLGLNPFDPYASLTAAANYDATSLRSYGGDYQKALAAYNAGGGGVSTAVSKCGVSWLSCMPSETQNYVKSILSGITPSASPAGQGAMSGSSDSGILGQVKMWGEYIAIFAIALFLLISGLFLIGGKQVDQVAGSAVRLAGKVAA